MISNNVWFSLLTLRSFFDCFFSKHIDAKREIIQKYIEIHILSWIRQSRKISNMIVIKAILSEILWKITWNVNKIWWNQDSNEKKKIQISISKKQKNDFSMKRFWNDVNFFIVICSRSIDTSKIITHFFYIKSF